jgi:hypothetical protein
MVTDRPSCHKNARQIRLPMCPGRFANVAKIRDIWWWAMRASKFPKPYEYGVLVK